MRRIVALAFKARVASVVGRSAILLALGFFAGCSAMWNEHARQIVDEILLFPIVIMSWPISILPMQRKNTKISLRVNCVR
jgi:hypothetical protein